MWHCPAGVARGGFPRERMGAPQAGAFDREARDRRRRAHPDGTIALQVVGRVVWGLPLG